MKAVYARTAAALALTFGLAACVSAPPPAPTPPPVVRPAPTATPTPTPPPVVQEPRYDNYLDAPQTVGAWAYDGRRNMSLAIFNGPDASFAIHCYPSARRIDLIVSNQPTREGAIMRIETETRSRDLPTTLGPGEVWAAIATLSPSDPLLDAMAITKGRFAVSLEQGRTLYLPAWVEVSRVIEDCR